MIHHLLCSCLLFLFSLSHLWGLDKTEVKYTIPNLMQLPVPILDALKTGSSHPDILRRGFVVQEYLAVTKRNIIKIFHALEAAGIPFGSQDELELFLFPGKTQEIRLMQKCIKEQGGIKELYQITLFGPGGLSCLRIETPEELDERQTKEMQLIFGEMRSEVTSMVRKAFFEIAAVDRSVEVDIYLNTVDGKLVCSFINGEIKLDDSLSRETLVIPSYFGIDISDEPRCKARNIALSGIPAAIQVVFESHKSVNQFCTAKILSEFKNWTSQEIIKLVFEPPLSMQGPSLHRRVLLNAEAFGFGPSAAIAELFPYLRDRVTTLSYIGTGHTLDLQNKLPYDAIYDCAANDSSHFLAIAKDYDVFITASDYEAARLAKSLGLTLIIYDPLTWYWQDLPEIISQADFYVAQNFFGVSERIKRESKRFPETAIVPPIISGLHSYKASKEAAPLFINLGGLSNPYLQEADLVTFAKAVFSAVHEVLEPKFQRTYYVSSKTIVNGTKEICPVTTMLPHQVQEILNSSKLAIMTSGLGNIFEAAAMGKFVIWLPPANDSQGQQIKLLEQHHMCDFAIDWHQILEDEEPINYFGPQQAVLKRIGACMQKLARSERAQTKLKELLENANALLQNNPERIPSLAKLAETFEVGGARQAAESIVQFVALHKPFSST